VQIRPRIINSIIAVVIAFSAYNCVDSVYYTNVVDIEQQTWNVQNKPSFSFEVKDTVNMYNFYLNVRNTNQYPYSNLYVFLRTNFPNGKYSVDTLECYLLNPDGSTKGKGFGSIKSHKIRYAYGKRFPINGTYTISLEQAMREDELKGIVSVGISIEESIKK